MYCYRKLIPAACCLLLTFAASAQNDIKPVGYELEMKGKDITSFAVLDTAIANYTVFFTGEDHRYVKDNVLVEMKFLRYLYQKAGVRHLILELGQARGFLLNKYVHGDTSVYPYLEAVTSKDYLRFYRNIKYFNDSLPADSKVSIWGIDVERFCDMPALAMASILPADKAIPEEIQLSVETLQGLASYYQNRYGSNANRNNNNDDDNDELSYSYMRSSGWYSCENTADSLRADFERQKAIYRSYLGDQFELFSQLMVSLGDQKKWRDYGNDNMIQQYVYREQFMYKQFRNLIHQFPEGRFYGQFGRCHISASMQQGDCNWYHHNSIARRINISEDPLMHGKVLSLAIFYPSDYYSEIQRELNIYTQANTDKGYFLYRTGQPEIKDSALKSRYQYVLINNRDITAKKRPEGAGASAPIFYEVTTFDLGVTSNTYNFNNLNGILPSPGFNTNMPEFNMTLMYIPENYMAGGISLQFSPSQKISLNANTSVRLNNYGGRLMLGHSFVPTPRLSILPYGTLGVGNLTMTMVNDSAANVLHPSFGSQQTSVYNNPGAIIGAGIDLRFAISYTFALRISGGYDYDISYYRWRYNNNLLASSPKTSLTCAKLGAGISILIP